MTAEGYGNLVTILLVVVLALTFDNNLRIGGGLGLVYGGLGALVFLAVVGTASVMGGIAACSFRLTKIVNI